MMRFNYKTICQSALLKTLSEKQREILVRRFGLQGERETLESIGKDFSVTRERVRQMEEDALKRLRERAQASACQNVFQYFRKYLMNEGLLKREDLLLADLGGPKFKNYVFFLLTLGKPFERIGETKEFHAFWTTDKKNVLEKAKKSIDCFLKDLERRREISPLPARVPASYVEISKLILRGADGLCGLPDWPEINPRGIKDKSYLVLKKWEKPLHFSQVARFISKDALTQTVHNELIKDSRFVLVGRGLYALTEWGYEPGVVREIVAKTIKKLGGAVDKDKIVKEVLKQRQVQPNTVLLNLQDKKYFIKNSQGRYSIRRA